MSIKYVDCNVCMNTSWPLILLLLMPRHSSKDFIFILSTQEAYKMDITINSVFLIGKLRPQNKVY